MSLDRLLAEEELGGDLAVRLPVSDELRDLAFAAGERSDSVFGRAGRASAVEAAPEPAQLALGLFPEARSPASVELGERLLELVGSAGAVACGRERSAGKRPGATRLDPGVDRLRPWPPRPARPGCCFRVASSQRNGSAGAVRHRHPEA